MHPRRFALRRLFWFFPLALLALTLRAQPADPAGNPQSLGLRAPTAEEEERMRVLAPRAVRVLPNALALKRVNDPSGAPMLDNTIIQWGVGLEDGNHNTGGMQTTTGHPTVLAGGKNFLGLGRFVALPNNDLSDLYFTINSKLGMGLTSFGGSTTALAL